MSHPAHLPRLLRFGQFELDLRTAELYKEGKRIKLQDQPCQVLALLIERPGEMVSREELRKKLWPNDTFVDFDHGLNIAISKLRDALGDSTEKPRFIETLPRHGYRFIAPLDSTTTSPDVESRTPVTSSPATLPRTSSIFTRPWLVIGPFAVAILAILLATAIWKWSSSHTSIQSLAVLPLRNLSGDSSQDYFADGMTDELITSLAKIRSLRVISNTSIMRYRNTQIPIPEIGQALHVDAVLEGAVVRSGDRVRITAQLIEARSDRHLWAEEYNRDLRDILGLQGEVARDIAREIKITVTPEESTHLANPQQVNVQAFEAYLRGRYFWNRRTEEGMKKAIAYFQQSIAKDPNSPLAYDGLADCWLSLGWYGYLPPKETFPQAKAAAMRALELDPTLGEAHTSIAFASMNYDWDWSTAEREFRKAIELNPNYANAHHWYADYLSAGGRHEEAITESKRALELDPVSPIINAWLGWRYFFARQYDLAIEQYLKTLDMDPSFVPAHLVLGLGYEQKSMPEKAIDELKKAVSLSGGSSLYVSALAHAYAVAGRRTEAEMLLQKMKERAQHAYVPSFHVAIIYAGLGQKDQAMVWLEKGYQERSAWMVWLKVDPRFDVLRSGPRFQDLLGRVGLP